MDNYDAMLRAAKKRFCTYDMANLACKNGVQDMNTHFCTTFLGEKVLVEKISGEMTVGGRTANFSEALTVFDWLCDRKEGAVPSYRFCPVSSLPGVYVRGSGLSICPAEVASQIDKSPQKFAEFCLSIGGLPTMAGDMGFQINAFPDLPLQMKFYGSDQEFSPSLTLLFDANILQFIRYETVYYLSGCLIHRLEAALQAP